MKTIALFLLLTTSLAAAEMQVHRDIPYSDSMHELHRLDIYAPIEGKDHPVLIWIHGGGWRQGDKTGVQRKSKTFVDRGFVFVSVNFRLRPEATVKEMTGDIAKAIKWIRTNAERYGGSAENLFVAGASSGAHLAALVCTDERFLEGEGISLSHIKGCIPVDVSVYDIPKRLREGGSVPPGTFTAIFGESEESQRDLSPVHHVGKEKGIASFLILHVADRPETRAQSEWFAETLRKAGVSATVIAAEGKNHGTISSDLGLPDDKPTNAIFEFLTMVLESPEKSR
ncbi:MAG TPA: alpha/beta hydrolase [Planctomicrobium sp.]|nr:alpha/beta hydrolase [Planctomicrobium sp.]